MVYTCCFLHFSIIGDFEAVSEKLVANPASALKDISEKNIAFSSVRVSQLQECASPFRTPTCVSSVEYPPEVLIFLFEI